MNTYSTDIETPQGRDTITCTDEQIDALPGGSLARTLRDQYRDGAFITPGEIALAYAYAVALSATIDAQYREEEHKHGR